MKKTDSQIFTSENFWTPFQSDLESSSARVIIQSPFISSKRINALIDVFRKLIENHVTICLYIQEPRFWRDARTEIDPQNAVRINEMHSFIKLFEDEGIHINLRKNIHEKLAVIDDFILWEGSLNILSYGDSKERMRRWTDTNEIKSAIELHNLDNCLQCTSLINKIRVKETDTTGSTKYQLLVQQLVAYRKSRNISQNVLAQKIGISKSHLSRIESGKTSISVADFEKLTGKLELEIVMVPKPFLPSVAKIVLKS